MISAVEYHLNFNSDSMRGASLKNSQVPGSVRQGGGIMAVNNYASKTQQHVNVSRPATTGKMRVNYNNHGTFSFIYLE